MPKVKAGHDDDYVDSPDDTVHTYLYKHQTVTIDRNQSAVVVEPVPNQRGEILVQFMKWVPLSMINATEVVLSSSGRRSNRTKHRPGYLVEDESFFTLPDSKYSSDTRQKSVKGKHLKGAGSMVTHAFIHDTVKGVFYNVPCQRNAKFNRKIRISSLKPTGTDKEAVSYIETKTDCNSSSSSSATPKEENSDANYESTDDSFDSSDDEASLPEKRLRTGLT